jgi:hypothetical protein
MSAYDSIYIYIYIYIYSIHRYVRINTTGKHELRRYGTSIHIHTGIHINAGTYTHTHTHKRRVRGNVEASTVDGSQEARGGKNMCLSMCMYTYSEAICMFM